LLAEYGFFRRKCAGCHVDLLLLPDDYQGRRGPKRGCYGAVTVTVGLTCIDINTCDGS